MKTIIVLLLVLVALAGVARAIDFRETFRQCADNQECVRCFSNQRDDTFFYLPVKAGQHIQDFLNSGKTCKEYIQSEPWPHMPPATAYPPQKHDLRFRNAP
jgi:hypothetical protein